MPSILSNIFKGDRKYFTIVFFILIIIIISIVLTPVFISKIKDNWQEKQDRQISLIRSSVLKLYKEKENKLIDISVELKTNLIDTLQPGGESYGSLVQLVNSDDYKDYSVEIVAPNGRLIAWNDKIAVPQHDIFPLNFPPGESYFYDASLVIYLSFTDTLLIQNDLFYFIVSTPIEKKYTLQNNYYEDIKFSKSLSDKFLTQFNIDYSSTANITRNNESCSFPIINNKDNKIGVVSFVKPQQSSTVNSFENNIQKVQSILIVFGLMFIAFGFRNKFRDVKYRSVKLILIVIYLVVFRGIIFIIGFPSNILDGSLIDPAYFSSAFGGGIVKSPVDFFVTNLFLLVISVAAFRLLTGYQRQDLNKNSKNKRLFFIIIIPISLLFFLLLRGLTSAVKSVIFDSTLRYFKELNLVPDLPSFVMNFNVLMLGLSSVLFLSCLVLVLLPFIQFSDKKISGRNFLVLFVYFQLFGFLFIIIQKQPLLNPLLNALFLIILFILIYYIGYVKTGSVYNFVYATLAASIITITLLNYFNLELEKESLKTTALEINRPNDNFFRFLINETLTSAESNEEIINEFSQRNVNHDADAFIIWSNSTLQKESLNSSVILLNEYREIIGEFSIGLDVSILQKINFDSLYDNLKVPEIQVVEDYSYSMERVFLGVIPVSRNNKNLGYITAAIGLSREEYGSEEIPEFLESKKNYINSVIDINQLKIFEYTNGAVTNVYGDIYPSREESEPILSINLSEENEAWIRTTLSGEDYLTYILRTDNEAEEKITAVSLREKDISWNLFNFFKIFILHTIIIIALFLILFFINIKSFRYSFRVQLLSAFLFISILPVIILAVYNRQVVNQRSEAAVFEELDERSGYVIEHVRFQLNENLDREFIDAFYNAGKELGISFSVYEFTNQVFSSKEEFYYSGLFDFRLNPQAYYNLYYLTYREYLTKEKIENYTYNSFYKKVNIAGSDFIIGVNDAFNKVKVTFSTLEVDVFLFGIYSFATIIIIIVSTFLANRISLPVRRLTKATDSVAHGDLNVELVNNEKGEMRDLFRGFNVMTSELRKNQVELAEMERESAWKEMAKQVAHEIKNPLTPMKLAVQQLIISYRDKTKNFDSVFEKVSVTILNQIENLSLIASEFSRFAKMPSMKLEKLDLLPIINETVDLFGEENIKINTITNVKSAVVEADKVQLRRLFINLVRNSIQASATIIEINIVQENKFYTITFKDNGTGVPEDIKDKIFEAGFTTKDKGMGLGLKLTKRFMESINGDINLLESSQEGTVFKLQIPQSS